MPLIIPSNSISAGGYEVANSLRFNDDSSDYLNRTGGTATDGKKFTYSAWFKRSEIGGGNELFCIYADNTNRLFLRNNGDTFELSMLGGFGSTTRQFRDPSAWYHFVIACDSTQATASDRGKWYLNGELIMTGSISLNQVFPHGQSTPNFYIGNGEYNNTVYTQYWDGYQSEVCFIDGQQLDPTSFGEFDEDSGIWKPIDVSGLTFGTNGFYLDFENSGSLGADVSGNGNNFTVNNLTAIDQTTDTPTNNFATGNPLDYSGTAPTLGNGNLSITSAELSDKPFRTTIAVSQGKWYMEYKCEKSGSDNDNHIGLWSAENSLTSNYVGYQLYSWGIFTGNGNKRNNQSYDSYGSAIAQNDIVMIALDKDNGKIWWGKNGTWFASGNPATGSNEAFSNINTVVGSNGFVSFCFLPQQKFSLNFGSPPFTISSGNTDGNGYGNFEYAVPSGYYALNTKNLAEYG
jgi:hypothetical protein